MSAALNSVTSLKSPFSLNLDSQDGCVDMDSSPQLSPKAQRNKEIDDLMSNLIVVGEDGRFRQREGKHFSFSKDHQQLSDVGQLKLRKN